MEVIRQRRRGYIYVSILILINFNYPIDEKENADHLLAFLLLVVSCNALTIYLTGVLNIK